MKTKKLILPLILILLLTFTLVGNCAWLTGYDQRIKLTIDNTKVDSALSDFPVTIFFTSTQAEVCIYLKRWHDSIICRKGII